MNPNQLHALQAMMVVMPIFILIAAAVMLIPWWFIYKKAGFSSWLCLLMVIPIINLIMLYVLAFTDWRVPPAAPRSLPYQPPYYPPSALPPQG